MPKHLRRLYFRPKAQLVARVLWVNEQKHHGVMFLRSEGAKARSVSSKLFAKKDDYATRVGGQSTL